MTLESNFNGITITMVSSTIKLCCCNENPLRALHKCVELHRHFLKEFLVKMGRNVGSKCVVARKRRWSEFMALACFGMYWHLLNKIGR
jgi:hypothetical protein